MQIVESTDWAVRSARICLRHTKDDKTIVLFPMLHIAEPAFFQNVYDDAFSLDIVLVEGIESSVGRRISQSYRWIKGSHRIDLAIQPPYPLQNNCRARIVRSDLSTEAFEALWRKVPLWQRGLIFLIAPLVGLQRRYLGSRQQLAKGLSFDDLPSREEYVEANEESGFLNYAILQARDDHLLEKLHEEIARLPVGPITIGIVYGAMHMRAVVRNLTQQHGYLCTQAEWMTVFTL